MLSHGPGPHYFRVLRLRVVQLRFEDVADPDGDGIVQELRSVETDLEPGQYRIHVRIRALDTGQTAVPERLLTVIQ